MEAFKEYLIQEFRDKVTNYVACEFKYSHSNKLKLNKASGVNLKIDVVKIVLKLYDRDMNVLLNDTITFENNVIPKSKEKSFINISPKELNNKFAFAKNEIIKIIMNEYNEKRDELNTKISDLKKYLGNESDIITPKMKGETVKIDDSNKNDILNKRVKFDM